MMADAIPSSTLIINDWKKARNKLRDKVKLITSVEPIVSEVD